MVVVSAIERLMIHAQITTHGQTLLVAANQGVVVSVVVVVALVIITGTMQ